MHIYLIKIKYDWYKSKQFNEIIVIAHNEYEARKCVIKHYELLHVDNFEIIETKEKTEVVIFIGDFDDYEPFVEILKTSELE